MLQGDALHKVITMVGQDEFPKMVSHIFPDDQQRPIRYMKLAKKIPVERRELIFNNHKQLDFAMHQVGLAVEPPQSVVVGTTEKSVSIAPIFERLTWLAEWTTKNHNDVATWPAERKQDLKQQLAPIVELWETL